MVTVSAGKSRINRGAGNEVRGGISTGSGGHDADLDHALSPSAVVGAYAAGYNLILNAVHDAADLLTEKR
jgi:hypothetical protein